MLLWFKIDGNIGDDGATLINEALKMNSTLTLLNLSSDRKKKEEKRKRD